MASAPVRALSSQSSRLSSRPVSDPEDRLAFFSCQQCMQSIRIHPSFYTMNEHTLAELTLPPVNPMPQFDFERARREADEAGHEIHGLAPPLRLAESHTHGFTFVDEQGDNVSLSRKMRETALLFDMLSESGEVDHPLCEECADNLLESMDQKLRVAEEEAQEYKAYLEKLESETEDDNHIQSLEKELETLENKEKTLREELKTLSEKTTKAEGDLEREMKAKKVIVEQEQKYWKEYSKFNREMLLNEDESKTVDCRLKYTESQLEKLKRLNIYNATFEIWYTDHFGTINGLRLGRSPSKPVDWNEINGAWGHTALLLWCLAKAIQMEPFQRYQLVPFGNFSYLKQLSDEKTLPLYGAGGFRMIFDSKFDHAMVAFLDCLQQFGDEVEKRGFHLPYEMERGKIKDNNTNNWYPIKLQFNSEDSWTKALRYMLTNLKWGLAFVCTKQGLPQDLSKNNSS
ncbi:hypothetical protein TCAL_06860 [Tigriopus californicus]|uniref:Beclin-1-like protein n=1 Tax=Tigriopus californicus TaxID=6832 RepID=A0A553NEK7_TIGCA|nr:beclin-1-like protein [Tigriopus californicus]TRY63845.1 hypothetical protein TCAL_06860 [Tigriopus californicus]|eukprot:TCALIF_06860-PA protein Name:"Similar to Atg6 Beclin-1-like protein (Drosophila melanogaster)" AED:0.01 eAED:0.01 QI:0/-1/0/1/-1/1/1/0/457